MKLYTLCRTAASCVLLLSSRLGASQTITLTLSPVETRADNTVQIRLFLDAPPNSAPAALQWILRLPPGKDIIGIEEGKAAKEAGKVLVCNGARCIVYGLNRTTILNGTIAVVKMKVDEGLAGGKGSAQFKYKRHGGARTKTQKIQIGDLVAASRDGQAITVVPGRSY